MRKIKRGEIYYVDLGRGNGSEIGKTRPCVIMQNDIGNEKSNTSIVVPISHRRKSTGQPTQPTQVVLEKNMQTGNFEFLDGLILGEQVRTIDKNRIRELVGRLDPSAMKKIGRAVRVSMDL